MTNARRGGWLAWLSVPLYLLAFSLYAQDTTLDRSSLKDLDGVRVVVEDLPADVASKTFTAEHLRKSIEDKLREAKIPVLNQGEFPVGDPFLRVRVTTTAPQKGLAAYRVEVDFAQIVFLRRNPMITFNRAQTWYATPVMGLAPPARLADNIKRGLAQQIEQFIAAYLAASPK
ncbi:MAG: hypothetical protein ABL995_00630 [Bryobacteraceae bacterium]